VLHTHREIKPRERERAREDKEMGRGGGGGGGKEHRLSSSHRNIHIVLSMQPVSEFMLLCACY